MKKPKICNISNIIRYKNKPIPDALRIIGAYMFFIALWFILSEIICRYFSRESEEYIRYKNIFTWVSIPLSSLILFIFLKKYFNKIKSFTFGCGISNGEKKDFSESELRYRLAIEGANDGIWEMNIPENTYNFSLKDKGYLGYDAGELNDSLLSWESLIHPDDAERARKEIYDFLKNNKDIYQNTYRVRCKNGEYKWILSRGKALRDSGGNAVIVAGSHTDLTNFIKIQEQLKLFDNIIRDVPCLVIVWNSEGIIKLVNPYTEKILGYTAEELIGRYWFEFFVPTYNNKKEEMVLKKRDVELIFKNFGLNKELRVKTKNGNYIYILWNSTLLRNDNGDVYDIVSVGTDITYRRNMEKKLRNLAYYDAITELPNRIKFESRIQDIIDYKYEHSFALVYVDVDNFKDINDTMGHHYGDLLLKKVAELMVSVIKPPDLAARLGGDEFGILYYEKSICQVYIEIKKLINKLKEPIMLDGKALYITVSMGVSLYPEHGKDVNSLMRKADLALYSVKAKGKNGYCIYSKDDITHMVE